MRLPKHTAIVCQSASRSGRSPTDPVRLVSGPFQVVRCRAALPPDSLRAGCRPPQPLQIMRGCGGADPCGSPLTCRYPRPFPPPPSPHPAQVHVAAQSMSWTNSAPKVLRMASSLTCNRRYVQPSSFGFLPACFPPQTCPSFSEHMQKPLSNTSPTKQITMQWPDPPSRSPRKTQDLKHSENTARQSPSITPSPFRPSPSHTENVIAC